MCEVAFHTNLPLKHNPRYDQAFVTLSMKVCHTLSELSYSSHGGGCVSYRPSFETQPLI